MFRWLPLAAMAIGFCVARVQANVLYFQGASPVLDLWNNPAHWYVMDGMGHLVPAGVLPLAADTAVITTKADAQANNIQVNTLILQTGVEVDNGAFIVQTLQMQQGSHFNGSAITVDSEMDVLGQNCTLTAGTLNITGSAL